MKRQQLSPFSWIAIICLLVVPRHASAQTAPVGTVTVRVAAPIFLYPDERRQPLIVAKEGSILRVLGDDGDWYGVEFKDPSIGPRQGFIQKRNVTAPTADYSRVPATDVSIDGSGNSATRSNDSTSSDLPSGATAPRSGNRASAATSPAMVFRNARLREQEGEKTKDSYVALRFDATQIVLDGQSLNGKSQPGVKSIAYADVTSAEYTFAKSPRVAAAILVSPFFLASNSKSHWLTIKSAADYTLLRLDKSNYKLIIAELEKRTRVKVADVGENK